MPEPQDQILFINTESSSKWAGPYSLEDLKVEIINKNIDSAFQVWIEEFCPNGHTKPEECELHDDDIVIENIEEIYDSLLSKKNNASINSDEFGEIVQYLRNQHTRGIDTRNTFKNRLRDRKKLKEFLKFVLLNSLNIYESYLIGSYCDLFAEKINSDLRGAFSDGKTEELIKSENLLNASLEKLNGLDNKITYVMFRTNGDEEEILNWFKNRIEKIIKFPNFISSSLRKWRNYALYLKIETKLNSRGKYVAPFTDKGSLEEEVTFMSGTKFKIVSYNEDLQELFLEELDLEVSEDYTLNSLFLWIIILRYILDK
jgi:hypothetical protein